jgi:Family of unknown function (DUF695)
MSLFDRFRSQRRQEADRRQETLQDELEDWRIVKAHNEASGELAIFRIRMAKPSRPDIASFGTAVVITWRFQGQVPRADVNQRQLAFERALDPLSMEGEAELVQVTTGMNRKEWLYYVQSSDAFMARLNALLADHPRYPIEIEFHEDPEWHLWRDIVDSLKGKLSTV